MNVRAQAIANENNAIEVSTQRAIAAREDKDRPRNALEALAKNLGVSSGGLKNALMSTVFSGCRNDAEFIALVIVANQYGLNPLLKEMYAFPSKGGGIVPMVSVDGWIRIMNEHPQFDGIEFENIVDQKGNVEAIEAVIFRKDRQHPTKVIEYLDECRRGTDPWKQMPKRMLRNRALIQGARIAFGFAGIAAPGDEVEFDDMPTAQALPSNRQLAEQSQPEDTRSTEEYLGDSIPDHDAKTGELVERDSRGMSEVDEETARELDGQSENGEGDQTDDEAQTEAREPWRDKVDEIEQMAVSARNLADLKKADAEFQKHAAAFPDQVATTIDGMLATRRKKFAK